MYVEWGLKSADVIIGKACSTTNEWLGSFFLKLFLINLIN